jgi:predicted Rossmann fold flavoprotein
MAAVSAAEHGGQVVILEKMKNAGKKLLITGKGRCNITNACSIEELIKNMPGNGSFLHSTFNAFDNNDMIAFLNKWGLETKTERGGRVFPASDKARDVVAVFEKALKSLNVKIETEKPATKIVAGEGKIGGVMTADGKIYHGKTVILAAGGATYPLTGSNGDSYRLAAKTGHTIVPLKPSLVPLETAEEWVKELQGLSLKNVSATIFAGNQKKIGEDFGEMIFTHYGISGPIILSLSKAAAEYLDKGQQVSVEINLKPALTSEVLDKRIQRDFEKFSRKQIKNSLHELLPAKLREVVADLAFLNPEKQISQITREERARLLETIRRLTLTVTKTRPLSEAIVTAGGVTTKEINAKTMESKILEGLYFAGEVIDVDGYTGGFNLQTAFSTGYVAGRSAALRG